MELIPILSTIVLVATVSTFLLAIGAYILFKVRERKGVHVYPKQSSFVEAELVTQTEVKQEIKPVQTTEGDSSKKFSGTYNDKQAIEEKVEQKEEKFQEYKKEGLEKENKITEEKKETAGEKKGETSKFLKYTSEGYIPPKDDKNSGTIRWR